MKDNLLSIKEAAKESKPFGIAVCSYYITLIFGIAVLSIGGYMKPLNLEKKLDSDIELFGGEVLIKENGLYTKVHTYKNPKKIDIFYGAGHMQGLRELLRKNGYQHIKSNNILAMEFN